MVTKMFMVKIIIMMMNVTCSWEVFAIDESFNIGLNLVDDQRKLTLNFLNSYNILHDN